MTTRRNLSTAERLAEYVSELRERGIPVRGAVIEGRTIKLDFGLGAPDSKAAVNPADLVTP